MPRSRSKHCDTTMHQALPSCSRSPSSVDGSLCHGQRIESNQTRKAYRGVRHGVGNADTRHRRSSRPRTNAWRRAPRSPGLRPARPKCARGWSCRWRTNRTSKALVVKRPFDDPVPASTPDLDLIILIPDGHDMTWQPVDREKLNVRLFAVIKPGKHFVVLEGRAGSCATRPTRAMNRRAGRRCRPTSSRCAS